MMDLSRREYFAAHAPAVVPDWFEPELPCQGRKGFTALPRASQTDLENADLAVRAARWPWAWADSVLARNGEQ